MLLSQKGRDNACNNIEHPVTLFMKNYQSQHRFVTLDIGCHVKYDNMC